jgi:hypothetical protein
VEAYKWLPFANQDGVYGLAVDAPSPKANKPTALRPAAVANVKKEKA